MKCQKLVAAILGGATTFAYAITEDPVLETIVVTGMRFEEPFADQPSGISVITRDMINESSARTIPELLTQHAGILARDLFGNNASSTTVDMRGFGAAAGQNTLILLDGRRITDVDLSGVQWSAIPFASIERIEVMRGSGSVLYGDGATNGVINIITKSPAQVGKSGKISVKAGSYGMAEVQANANYFSGQAGFDITASRFNTDGYRANNQNEQTNVQANTRWKFSAGELALKLGIDRQEIRLPGARLVQPDAGINLVETDPRGTATPLDYASRDGNWVAVEWKQRFSEADVNIGVARRTKNQKSFFDFNGFPNYRDGDMLMTSFTPRIKLPHALGGEGILVAGMDLYRWNYDLQTSNSPMNIGQPINQIFSTQKNSAWYLQNTTYISQATSLLAGMRNERVSMNAYDVYNDAAPGGIFGSAAPPGYFARSRNAYELGLHHKLSDNFSLNGKIGRGFRFANIDEIYESSPSFSNQFQFLRPQSSDTYEISAEHRLGKGRWRMSIFNIKVRDEIHLDPYSTGIGNTNLPPTLRRGMELDGKWQVSPWLVVNAAYTYINAKFLSGTLDGGVFTQTNVNLADKKVPLVPASKLNLGLAWTIHEKTFLNASIVYVGSQFMDNDQANNFGTKIPAYTIAEIKLIHTKGPWQASAAVNNLFDRDYYSYAVSSQFVPGRYNAYPLPGRMLFLGLSYQE